MSERLDETTVEDANNLLAFLSNKICDEEYQTVMRKELDDTEFAHSMKILKKILRQNNLESPAGVVASGTGIIKEEAGLSNEAGQRAIRALKQTQRIQQCGRGRGKCIVIITTTGISSDITQPEEDEGFKRVQDVPATLRELRDIFRGQEEEIALQKESLQKTERTIEELNSQLNDRDRKIEELQNQLRLKTVTTWH